MSRKEFVFNGSFSVESESSSKSEVSLEANDEIMILTNRFSQDLEYEIWGDLEYLSLEVFENNFFKQILPPIITKSDQLIANSTGTLIVPSFSAVTFRLVPLLGNLNARAENARKV